MSQPNQTLAPTVTESASSEPGTPKRKRILLVEGDGFTRLVLLLRLRLAGFAVDYTSNGMLGLGKLRGCHPDILLLDLKLYGLSGMELIRAARADSTFGNRPIFVFTNPDKMNRATRKELPTLGTKILDKRSTTREDLVRIFATTFLPRASSKQEPLATAETALQAEAASEALPPGAIEELIAGVREQSNRVASCGDPGARFASCGELLSRVRSLASCAEAAGLPDLARHTKALEDFLDQLGKEKQRPTDAALATLTRAVEVMPLMSPGLADKKQNRSHFSAVVVDEVPPSNKAVKQALATAGFAPIAFEDPARALDHLAANSTELIIANVVLPEAHGLALATIRRLPLHAETPVIFVPEPSAQERFVGELATSAPRLDTQPLLLKELIVKALNEVQRTKTPEPVKRKASGPAPTPALALARAVAATPAAPESSPLQDGFEIFAAPKRCEENRLIQAPAEEPLSAVPVWSVAQPVAEAASLPPASPPADGSVELSAAVFTAAGLPSESLPQVEPGVGDADLQAEVLSALPAAPIDAPHTDDQLLEMLQASIAQPQAAEPPKPEPTLEDLIAEAERLAAAESDAGELVPAPEPNALPEVNEPLSARQSALATPDPQDAEHQPLPAQSESPHEAECAQPAEATQTFSPEREELVARIAQEQQLTTELRARIKELEQPSQSGEPGGGAQVSALEQQVRQGVAALARATADLAKERGDRQRSEQRTAALNARLQELHEELSRTLQLQRADLERIGALEAQLHQTEEALARRTADVEQQQAEHGLAEEQLRTAKELNAQLRKNLTFFEESNKTFERTQQDLQARLEASLSAARERDASLQREGGEDQRRAETRDEVQRELQDQSRKREALERELQATRGELQESEARSRKETAERQRLQEALESAQINLRDRAERSELEVSKLQSALQLEQAERKHQEAELAHIHHASVDSVRAVRALRNSLRRQVREPIDNLYHSTRSLLELELGEPQKKLAEAVLQDALLVHTRLREPELTQTDPAETEETPTITAT
jgi:DNA-binding response OmpR family regulator